MCVCLCFRLAALTPMLDCPSTEGSLPYVVECSRLTFHTVEAGKGIARTPSSQGIARQKRESNKKQNVPMTARVSGREMAAVTATRPDYQSRQEARRAAEPRPVM